MISEWELIEQIKGRTSPGLPAACIRGIGDDCAVFQLDSERYGLITTDISIENTHFKRDFSSFFDIGYKAMTANISDIAAMGGKPLYAFISLGVTQQMIQKDVSAIYDGMLAAMEGTGAVIPGGDISGSEQIVLNIALYGEVNKDRVLYRDGAKEGDNIYVTGTLGDSLAGLDILESGIERQKSHLKLIEKHVKPGHKLQIVDNIIEIYSPSAMIDISDGLLSDLRHLCNASNKGFFINKDNIPISEELLAYNTGNRDKAITSALKSGEEYELLFTSKKDISNTINTMEVTKIGEITSSGFEIKDKNKTETATIEGFDHFKRD